VERIQKEVDIDPKTEAIISKYIEYFFNGEPPP
jgi:hypothetical protein